MSKYLNITDQEAHNIKPFDPGTMHPVLEITKEPIYFHERVRVIRERQGITQVQLAKKVGVARNTLANFERGETVPLPETMVAILEGLGYKLNQAHRERVRDILEDISKERKEN